MPLKKVSKRNSGKKLSKKQSGGSRPRRKATKKNPPTLHNDEGYCLLYNNCKKQPFIHTNVNLYWGPSTLKGAGNGVFAGKAFKKGEIVEIAPIIKDTNDNWGHGNQIANYTTTSDENSASLTLGYGSLYNHSNDNNLDYYSGSNDTFIFIANRPIKKNAELFISYGEDWWTSRQGNIKMK